METAAITVFPAVPVFKVKPNELAVIVGTGICVGSALTPLSAVLEELLKKAANPIIITIIIKTAP